MKPRCPKGGTHVWPHAGRAYDDGKCLKCGTPRDMNLSLAQRSLLDYLAGCNWASPRTILKVKAHGANVIKALERRGLVEYGRSPYGKERVYITDAGRELNEWITQP